MTMRPIPESTRADEMYGPFMWGDVDLFERLQEVGTSVRELVPECVGMSVSLRDHGVTLTLVATDRRVAGMDAVQYVDGGPCTDALRDEAVVDARHPKTLEDRWTLFSLATTHNGIEATLSLPVPWEGAGVLGFNLYASKAEAFDECHDALAELLGAWAEGAVVDADLSFKSERLARRAPQILQESTDVAIVSVMLAQARDMEVEEAEKRLREAAVRANISLAELLDLMRTVLSEDAPPGGAPSASADAQAGGGVDAGPA